MIVSSRKIHQKFANFLVAPSRPRNCGDQLPAPLFFISDFFRKVQEVRRFILGFKGEILILAKMELPFRFLEPPRPDGTKNRISRGSKTRLLKFPHYLFDFSLGLSPRTFLPIKKPLFFLLIFSDKTFFARNRLFSPFSVLDHKGKTRFFRERNLPRGFSEPPRFFGEKTRNFGNFISRNDHFSKFSVVSFDFSLGAAPDFFPGFLPFLKVQRSILRLFARDGPRFFSPIFYWRTRIFLLENSRIFSASVRQATEKQASPGKKSLGI